MAEPEDKPTNQSPNEPIAGNSPDARNEDGSLKDQNSTPLSGQEKKTSSEDSPKPDGKSFLNREEKKSDASDKGDSSKSASDKSGNEKTDGGTDKGKSGDKVHEGAPEKYADFKLPDGYKIDDDTLKSATAVFKDLGLPQEGAQRLVDFYTEKFTTAAEAPYKLWADTQTGWVDTIISDHGEAKANEMRNDINKGIEAAFAPKLQRAFREAIDLTGAGSNPAMFEAFHTLFKPFLEGTPVRGGGPSKDGQTAPGKDTRPSIADSMYPHLVKNREQ